MSKVTTVRIEARKGESIDDYMKRLNKAYKDAGVPIPRQKVKKVIDKRIPKKQNPDKFEFYIKESHYDNLELIRNNLKTNERELVDVADFEDLSWLREQKNKLANEHRKKGDKVWNERKVLKRF